MESFKIGLSATLSGRHAVQGIQSLRGIKLFAERLRARGGIKTREGRLVVPELVFHDDSSDPLRTAENTRRLIEKDRVDILLGPYSSSLTLACMEAAAEEKRVVWNYGGSSDDIPASGCGKTVSAITGSSRYFHPVVDLVGNFRDRPGEIALVGTAGSPFSLSVREGARLHAESLGLKAPLLDFPAGTRNFSEILSAIKKRGVDCVLCCGGMEDDINLARWISENRPRSFRMVATLAGAINEFKNRLGKRCESFVSTSQWEPALDVAVDFGPTAREFSEEFASFYGYLPDYTAAQSYNMGLIVARLIEKTSSTDEEVLFREALGSEFTTFYGDFRTDPETMRQTGHSMLVIQWQSGEKKIISPERHSGARFASRG